MFRNMYDNDVSIWSPQGRLYQVEYAMEAVKQGSVTIGLKSDTHAVICALKRAPSELSAHQKKMEQIDNHIGISMAGLSSDARHLARFMRLESIQYKYDFGKPIPTPFLMNRLTDICQPRTMMYGSRPLGVGLLIASYDESSGPHLYQLCPSATFYDCRAMALGNRSQSARTYFEKNQESFAACSLDELIQHGLIALRDTLPNDAELNGKNCSIGIVGNDRQFTILNAEDTVVPYLLNLPESHKTPALPAAKSTGEPASEDQPASIDDPEQHQQDD